MVRLSRLGHRLGILGGTFDPPHLGHLILAEYAAAALALEQIWFMPAASPPHKTSEITSADHRAAMVTLAIEGNPRFSLSRIDLDRPGPHYTVEMLRLVRAQTEIDTLYFLMGADSLHNFATWRDPAAILDLALLAVVQRPGTTLDLTTLATTVPAIQSRVTFVDAPEIAISSTALRTRVQQGLSIRYQVPPAVSTYIEQQGLYRA